MGLQAYRPRDRDAVFAGRLLLRWAIDRAAQPQTGNATAASTATADRAHGAAPLILNDARLGGARRLDRASLFSDNRYVVDTATTVLIYVMLGWGLNVVGPRRPARPRLRRLLRGGRLFLRGCCRPSSAGASGRRRYPARWRPASGSLLGYPILRLRGDYLAIVTLGFGEIIRIILVNWTEFSNGPNGISSIPRRTSASISRRSAPEGRQTFAGFFGLEFSADAPADLPLLPDPGAGPAHPRLRRAPARNCRWGAPGGAREDEIACRAMGMTPPTSSSAFAIGAMLGSFWCSSPRTPGLHLARELHLHRVGDHPRHRRARRHGLTRWAWCWRPRCWC